VSERYHKPIWLTEYALMRFGPTQTPTAADQAAFVTSSTAMLLLPRRRGDGHGFAYRRAGPA
jgi:hypothetical protein